MPMARHLKLAEPVYCVETREFGRLLSGRTSDHLRSVFSGYSTIIAFSFSEDLVSGIRRMAPCPVVRVPPRPEAHFRVHVADFLVHRLAGIFPKKDRSVIFPFPCPDPASAGPVLIHPGSGSLRKNWPPDDFIRIYRSLNHTGKACGWVVGPAETFMIKELRQKGVKRDDIHVLNGLIDFISHLKRSSGMIGNDSGLSHLAAFLGHRVIAVFGPSDPVRWKPLGPGALSLRPETACTPCFEINPENCGDPVCLKRTTAEDILTKLKTRCFV